MATPLDRFDLTRFQTVNIVGFAVLLVVSPLLFGKFVMNEVLVLSIFAIGYNLILGYGGELSLGHAAYFGLGAYTTILFTSHVVANLYLAIVAGVVVSAFAAALIGAFSLRRRGVYFAMITLAFAQMVYYVVFQWNTLTGGDNGIALDTVNGSLGGFDPTAGGTQFYVFGIVMLVLVWLVTRRIVNSPFGHVLTAIRENETRAVHIGYDVNRYLLIAFVMSGAISGFGGALYAVLFSFVTPNLLLLNISSEVAFMALLGGIGTFNGPIVGAFIYTILSDYLSNVTKDWQVFFGAVIVLMILFIPDGLYGVYKNYFSDEEVVGFDVQDLLQRLNPRDR